MNNDNKKTAKQILLERINRIRKQKTQMLKSNQQTISRDNIDGKEVITRKQSD